MNSNATIKILEPNSFGVYLAILILSLIIFLASCCGIMYCLFLSYNEWSDLIHQYCSNIVYMRIDDDDCESSRKPSIDVDTNMEFNPSELSEEEPFQEPVQHSRYNPDHLLARFTKFKFEVGEGKDIQIIELEPTGFVDNDERTERQIQNRGPDKELGSLSFTIQYFPEKQELHIKDLRGINLRKKHSQDALNPYVTVNIWPDDMWPIKTKALKKSINPIWSESIVIEQFESEKLPNKAIHLKVQSKRPLKSNELIGHVILPLRIIKCDDNNSFKKDFIKHIQPDLQIHRGSIRILLHCSESKDEMKITILCAELKYSVGTSADQCQVFVRISLIQPEESNESKSTTIHRGSFKPVWNEHLLFKFSPKNIYKLKVIISVREESFSKEGKFFASAELGPDHSESNNFHLYTTLKNPGKTFAQWHQLISNIL